MNKHQEMRAALQALVDATERCERSYLEADERRVQAALADAKALLARPEPDIDSYAGDQPRGVFTNTGYHGTACGFIVRDGSLWSVTFKTQQDADDYVAWKNSPPEPEPRITREEAEQLLERYVDAILEWRVRESRASPAELNSARESCLAAMGVKQ